MAELPDEVREQAVEAVIALYGHGIPKYTAIVDAIAPILLAYQAKVDAEIVRSEKMQLDWADWNTALDLAAGLINVQFDVIREGGGN